MNQCRTENLDVRGVAYSVHRWGDPAAPHLFLLHGWGDSGRTFQLLVDALLPGWHVIAPDWRGFGGSGWAADGYYFPDYLADLDRLLEHYSAQQPAALVGHSMGGNVAALYAGSRPDRVAALANLEGFGLKEGDPSEAPTRYAAWLAQQRTHPAPSTFTSFAELAERIRRRHPGLSGQVAGFAARHWGRQIGDRVILKADPKHRWVNPVLYRRAEAVACWRAVAAPVLLMVGEQSPFARGATSRYSDDGIDAYRHARRIVIEGCGHMLHWEQPAAVARHLRTFLLAALQQDGDH